MTTEIETEESVSREAEHGEKTVAFVLRFFTDGIAEQKKAKSYQNTSPIRASA